MKEFTITNKIFQANKVVLPQEQLNKPKDDSLNFNNNQHNVKNNESFNKQESKLRLEKKLSVQQMPTNYGFRSPTYAGNNNNASFNFMEY